MEEERLFPIDIHYNKLLGEVTLNQIFHDSARPVLSVLQRGNLLRCISAHVTSLGIT